MTVWAFEDCELDTDRYELRRAGAPVAVEPQVFDVLAHLVANRDRVVDKHELLDAVWHTRFVTESTLTSRIKAARRAVGDDGRAQRVIRTVHGLGYRFVADVTDVAAVAIASARPTPSAPVVPDPEQHQQIGFCTAPDGVRIAYATVGTGKGSPLVKAANWLTNLRHDWTSVVWRHWLRDLSTQRPLVLYDERGCGMSDWDVDDVSFDARVRDLETVVDALALERFPLLGISQGGAVAAAYAARHRDRVTHLVLYGAFPLGRNARARSDEEQRDAAMMLELLETGWGRDGSPFASMFASQFMPRGTPEQWAAFVELQRTTTSTRNALRLMRESAAFDVTDVAPRIDVPTLVLHARHDHRIPVEQGELFAALVPGARFVALASHNHILLDGEPAWAVFVDEVRRFLSH
jgi:pimeloyl-ACP methyl ester carboxylesterase/DNA-binding winged helix-turn-helix (wHTH) protein